ncbi:condensin-2 complex subunit H2-like isoform X2 [Haemaphysalis longicornis]
MQAGSMRQQRKDSQDTDTLGGTSQRHRAQDRDIEQRYATLLTPIRDMTKNFEVDIAAYLDQYLDELSQTPITYQEGEASINFTQAAFLIQGSAFVYGKKVEYLHALVQKMAGEIASGSSKNQDSQDNSKESSGAAARRRKEDTQYMAHEEMELADSLDDLPTPRQAARNQAVAAQKNLFRRQRQRPLSMVVFDTEKQIKLHDCKQDVVGYKVDYRLFSGVHYQPESQDSDESQVRGEESSANFGPNFEDASSLDVADSAPGSPLSEPPDAEPIPFCGDIAAFEECPAKPETQDTCPTSPVPPPVRQTPRRVKEERIKKEMQAPQPQHILLIKRLHDPMEDVLSMEKPLVLRRRTRKRPHEDSAPDPEGAATDVIVPVATLWVKQGQFPHSGDDDGPNDDNNDIDLGAFADADLPVESAQGPPSTPEEPPENSYENLVHNYLREISEPMSEFQLSDLQKRVADWETRIRPLLDMEEERESFNIRTYCNRVLDNFSDAPSKQTLGFRSICRGKPVWEVPRYFASTLQLANNYNVQLETDGIMEQGMDTLQLTLLSRKQHFHELEEFGDSSTVTGTPPSQPARKGKQARKRVASSSHPEDPSDVLRENPVVPDPDLCVDPRLPPAARSTTARGRTRMCALASLAEDSSEDENDENMVAVA